MSERYNSSPIFLSVQMCLSLFMVLSAVAIRTRISCVLSPCYVVYNRRHLKCLLCFNFSLLNLSLRLSISLIDHPLTIKSLSPLTSSSSIYIASLMRCSRKMFKLGGRMHPWRTLTENQIGSMEPTCTMLVVCVCVLIRSTIFSWML